MISAKAHVTGSGDTGAHRRKGVLDLRCPRIDGLPVETVHLLHHSLTQLVVLRRSLEHSDTQLERARHAVLESRALLARLREQGL